MIASRMEADWFDAGRQMLAKWIVELLLSIMAIAAYTIRKVLNANQHSSFKMTQEQLNMLLSERASEVMILKSENQDLRADREALFIHNTALQSDISLMKAQMKSMRKQMLSLAPQYTDDSVKEEIYDFIAKSKLKAALAVLEEYAESIQEKDSSVMLETIQFKSQLADLEKSLRINEISSQEARIIKSNIREGILSLVDQLFNT